MRNMICTRCGHTVTERERAESGRCFNCGEDLTPSLISKIESLPRYVPLVRKVLEQCHTKIDLYNQADQRYRGGVEATRLLKNIEETLSILPEG